MFERIIEIIVYVISELRQNKHISEIDIKELQKLGYTSAEISTAFSWLVDRIELNDKVLTTDIKLKAGSFRILHEAEQELFSRDAWGELIQLHTLGVVGTEHIESLIERALLTGMHEIDTGQLRAFVATMIFNAEGSASGGSRYMLNGSDTIN